MDRIRDAARSASVTRFCTTRKPEKHGRRLSELRSESNPDARFEVFDSSLSEEGVLGFEYGYTVVAQDALVLWEAQFGDFGNGAQTIIDQYIAASEDKWKQTSRLVMLLPHGYEGQGPEHSSARLERYLQLCAENNLAGLLSDDAGAVLSSAATTGATGNGASADRDDAEESAAFAGCVVKHRRSCTSGGFQPVIDDAEINDREAVKKVVLCSGKVYYDLIEARKKSEDRSVAVVRLEQFYPFPLTSLREMLAKYSNASAVGLGAGRAAEHGWLDVCSGATRESAAQCERPRYVGRSASASPATGSYSIHQKEQAELVAEALK